VLVPGYYEREIYSPYDYMARRLVERARAVATVLFSWDRRNPPVPGAREEVLRGTLRTLAGSGFERFDLGTLDAEPAALDRGLALGIGARDRMLGGRWVRWPGWGL